MSVEIKTTLTKQQIKHKIENEEDFIDYPRFNNSIKKLTQKHPNGVKTETISRALGISVDEVEETFQSALKKLKRIMKIGKEWFWGNSPSMP